MNYLKVVLTDENEDLIVPINELIKSKVGNQEFTAIALNDLKKYQNHIGSINIDSFYEPIGNKHIDKDFIIGLLDRGKQLYVISNRFYYEDLKKKLQGLPVTYSFI